MTTDPFLWFVAGAVFQFFAWVCSVCAVRFLTDCLRARRMLHAVKSRHFCGPRYSLKGRLLWQLNCRLFSARGLALFK